MDLTETKQFAKTYAQLYPNFQRWQSRVMKEGGDKEVLLQGWANVLQPFTWSEALDLLEAFKCGAQQPLRAVEYGDFAHEIRRILYSRHNQERKDAELAKELERTRIIKTMRAQRRPVDEINAVLASHGMDDWAGYDAMKGLKLALKGTDE